MNILVPQMLRTPLQDVPPFATQLLLRTFVRYRESPTPRASTPSYTCQNNIFMWWFEKFLTLFLASCKWIYRTCVYKSQSFRFSVRKLRHGWRTNPIEKINDWKHIKKKTLYLKGPGTIETFSYGIISCPTFGHLGYPTILDNPHI